MATVDANILEAGQFTRLDDLVLFPTGAAVGAALGLLAYVVADGVLGFRSTEPLLYFTGIGGGAGLLLTQWWLCDEAGQFTRLDDLVLFPTGAAVGAALGLLAYVVADGLLGFHSTEPLLYFTGIGGGAGLLLTQWWLCDEAVVRRKAWRWFQELQSKWLLINEDEHKPVVLEVSHRERDGGGEQGRTIQYFGELPCEPDVFNDYVKSILAGETLAIAQWTGATKPFSRQQYEAMLDILKQAGAVITYPGKGNKLTRKGYRTLESYLNQLDRNAPLPLPPERA